MKSDIPLDYAVFQLSPKRSRCELLVSYNGTTEKLASGLIKPFVSHLKVAEEQAALAVKSIKLEVERHKSAETWFSKGTVERFVRFVGTPEVLEMVHTFDAEMSQLEAARRIYSQGAGDSGSGGDVSAATTAYDATKKELVRAIDIRLITVRQDLTSACTRASAAGFNHDTVSELQLFADRFGAHRLSEACSKFISLCERRPNIITSWKPRVDDCTLRSSSSSDMSLDDPADNPQTGFHQKNPQRHQSEQLEQSKPSTSQPASNKPSVTLSQSLHRSTESSFFKVEIDDTNKKDRDDRESGHRDKDKRDDTESEPSTQTGQPMRRLSVQDRINLFENKQKENSSFSAGSGGRPIVVGKSSAELRRLSSDVSSSSGFEKAVLRRWSAASDMSIDHSGERKDSYSNSGTPTSVDAYQAKSCTSSSLEDKDQKWLSDTGSAAKPETKVSVASGGGGDSGIRDLADSKKNELENKHGFGAQMEVFSVGSEVSSSESKLASSSVSGSLKNVGWKDQSTSKTQSRSTHGGAEEFVLQNQSSKTVIRSLPGESDPFSSRDQEFAGEKVMAIPQKTRFAHSESGSSGGQLDGEGNQIPESEVEDIELRKQHIPRSHFRASQRTLVAVESDSEDRPRSGIQNKGVVADSVASISKSRSDKLLDRFLAEAEVLDTQKMKFQRHVSASKYVKKPRGRRDDGGLVFGNSQVGSMGKSSSENLEISSTSATPTELQRVRPLKGNHSQNDELQMKADELEKLFAEHKLRGPGDQSNSTQRNIPIDMQIVCEASPLHSKPALQVPASQLTARKTMTENLGGSSNINRFNSTPVTKKLDDQDCDVTPKQSIYTLGFSNDLRGKSYARYIQKRDAKLREEWSLKRVEKEARMKAMQDSLERSRAELKSNLAGSADRHDAEFHASRAEKLRSFRARSTRGQQLPSDAFANDEDEDQAEFSGRKLCRQDGCSRSAQTKRLALNKSIASSTPRTSAAAVSRLSVKASNANLGRRKSHSENSLVQSVPNFSDFRKENSRPPSGSSKVSSFQQMKSYTRSRSSGEEMSRQSQLLKKSSTNPLQLNDFSSFDSDSVVLASLYDSKEENEGDDEFSRNTGSKPFMRKGNGVGVVTGFGMSKSKSLVALEIPNNGDEESTNMMAKEEVDDFESMEDENCADTDNGKPILSWECDKPVNFRDGNSDAVRCVSQTDAASVARLPTALPSTFCAMGLAQESPGESPGSWSIRMNNPFSFSNEISDVDASMDSPLGSPAYWNPHPVAQTEVEAARMRKKWGAAQKPVVVADSSHSQSRKDITKGLKRLLKFGWKNRGAESLADWISATTSEGDDDTEDGKDPASQSSEDLRKSRMGFLQGHASYDGFNETDFNEQVQAFQSSIPASPSNFKLREEPFSASSLKAPRSFFSLSTFRGKGSDSKPR
ncbi:hypothetical protein Nepgr_019408 [Nepenthes gracilis]|uniref:COP1-interacting protein 7 n=1 Tax=Nepenthes gracilis TaxID=150966 RepID=A0AAD3SVV7_NEPGR|nr:hypothetical protein Nepgr_019408 [Nepenthes gracilis]